MILVMRLWSRCMAVMTLTLIGGASNSMQILNDPYVQALHAVQNYSGCRLKPHADVGRVEMLFAQLEAEAKAKGLGDYISTGRQAYRRWSMNKLMVGCHPNEPVARREAEIAIDHCRDHIREIANTKR